MNKKAVSLTISWILWSVGYYLFYPFLSIFLNKVISEPNIPKFYMILQIFAVPLPLIGGFLGEKLGRDKLIIISMGLSGVGLILLPFSHDFTSAIIFGLIYYLFGLSLPNYYIYMSSIGKGYISLIWGYSILPSLFSPYLGGVIAESLSIETVFRIAGVFFILAGLPIFYINNDENVKSNNLTNDVIKIDLRRVFLPMICIIPIAIISPFIYLYIFNKYNLDYIEIGILSTLAEVLGMILVFIHYKVKRTKEILSVSLFLFSLISLTYYNPIPVIFFGLWESIIPLSLEYAIPKQPVKVIPLINSLQFSSWLIGYVISYAINNPDYLILLSSILVLIDLIILNFPKI